MIRLSAGRLARLGYRGLLTRDQTNDLLRELYNAGEEIVGLKLAAEMSNEQLDAFEKFVQADDSAGAFAWLERNFPNYREVVRETFAELDEVLRGAAQETKRKPDVPDPAPPDANANEQTDADVD